MKSIIYEVLERTFLVEREGKLELSKTKNITLVVKKLQSVVFNKRKLLFLKKLKFLNKKVFLVRI